MSEPSSAGNEPVTPSRMTTRGVPRVNYAELNASGGAARFSDESEPFFRTPTASTRGRKRRIPGDDFHSEAGSVSKRGRPRGGGVARGGRGGARRSLNDPEDKGIFGAGVLESWVSSYEENDEVAMLELLQFVVSACGCRAQLTQQMIHEQEYSQMIKKLTEEFDEDSGDYPLMGTGPYRKFRHYFKECLYKLITKCSSSILYDNKMMDSVWQLLTGLADSQVRAFRHTATFAALKISSALVEIATSQADLKEKNQRQVEAEKQKVKQQKATSERLDALMEKKAEIETKIEEIRSMLSYIYKSVFCHRYRDVLPDIRSICIYEMGQWIFIYPAHFLDDSFLKYIGWTLHDKVADVRLKCIEALLPLYTVDALSSKLELFTNKFKERLVSMVQDKDVDVAVKSCQLLANIYRVFPSLLAVADCIPIYEQVYANHRALAVAAGEFLNCKVFQQSAAKGKDHQKKLLTDLVIFYSEGEVHEHAAYLVDALMDTNPMVKEWAAMVELLLDDNDEGKQQYEGALIEVMTCAVKQAATGEFPVGRTVVRRGAPAVQKEAKVLKEERRLLSVVFIPTITQLLQKFMADRDKVALLVTIPTYFNLEVYMTSHWEKHVTDLMDTIKNVMERHTDDEIMSACAEVITLMATNTLTNQLSETFRIGLVDTLVLQLKKAVTRFNDEAQLDDEDDAALRSALSKIAGFLTNMELRRWELWDVILPVVASVGEGKHPSTDVLEAATQCLCFLLQYDLNRLLREEGTKADAIKKLKKRRDQFIHACDSIMGSFASGVQIAFNCLVDVLVCFSQNDAATSDAFKALVVNVPNELVSKMSTFVEDNVFADPSSVEGLEQTAQIELMHSKRAILAQYAKLILHGVLPYQESAGLLNNYLRFYSDFGDIMKLLLGRMRDTDRISMAKTSSLALRQAFEQARENDGTIDAAGDVMMALKELAKKLAASLGNDYRKARDALAVIHRDGIIYALTRESVDSTPRKKRGGPQTTAPLNVAYLEVIQEFSNKLHNQDKRALRDYLERRASDQIPTPNDENWASYFIYKGSLTEKNDDTSSMHSFAHSVRGRGRGRGRGGRMTTPMEI